jgi:hypothetical protein
MVELFYHYQMDGKGSYIVANNPFDRKPSGRMGKGYSIVWLVLPSDRWKRHLINLAEKAIRLQNRQWDGVTFNTVF